MMESPDRSSGTGNAGGAGVDVVDVVGAVRGWPMTAAVVGRTTVGRIGCHRGT